MDPSWTTVLFPGTSTPCQRVHSFLINTTFWATGLFPECDSLYLQCQELMTTLSVPQVPFPSQSETNCLFWSAYSNSWQPGWCPHVDEQKEVGFWGMDDFQQSLCCILILDYGHGAHFTSLLPIRTPNWCKRFAVSNFILFHMFVCCSFPGEDRNELWC